MYTNSEPQHYYAVLQQKINFQIMVTALILDGREFRKIKKRIIVTYKQKLH
jgi:hypothetical protein